MVPSLFRKESLDYHSNRLQGEVIAYPHIAHSTIAVILLIWSLAVALWLTTGTYDRKETVSGWIEPDQGSIKLHAKRPGFVETVYVGEGEAVKKGDAIAIVSGRQILEDGTGLSQSLLEQYKVQNRLLDEQLANIDNVIDDKAEDLENQINATEAEMGVIRDRILNMEEQLEITEKRLSRIRSLFEKQMIAETEVERVVEHRLGLDIAVKALQLDAIQKQSELDNLRSRRKMLPMDKLSAIHDLRTRKSDIQQQISELKSKESEVIYATATGKVTNLQIQEGQYIDSGIPLLYILPENYKLIAQLLVPVSASGFIAKDQKIKIRFDAFPYQKFGAYDGIIKTIPKNISLPGEIIRSPLAIRESMYVVEAAIAQDKITAYGRDISLKPGMTISVDITLDTRTILGWIFEPIISLRGRV